MEIQLIDSMGNDQSIVQAARVSYGPGTKTPSEDRQLIRYLMRNWHTTPFEMVEFKFRVKVPIFVARQWLRHRTASVNEISARYSVVEENYWLPEEFRKQSSMNKQGSTSDTFDNIILSSLQKESCDMAFKVYDKLLKSGVSRELARVHLPQGTFTEFYWKINLHNLFHFLRLRIDEHAQPEIVEPSKKIFELIRPIVPEACKAFEDYRLNSLTLTGPELRALQTDDTSDLSVGELREYNEKRKKIVLKTSST
jgi:thymidylate synthase (FAD)